MLSIWNTKSCRRGNVSHGQKYQLHSSDTRGAYISSIISTVKYMYAFAIHKGTVAACGHITPETSQIIEKQYPSLYIRLCLDVLPGRVAQSLGHLTRKSGVLGSVPGLATYFRFSFRFFKKGSCQLLAKVCARSIG